MVFELSLEVLYRFLKLRFLVISILLIVGSLIFSLWAPVVPQFQPVYSIYSDANYGHSDLIPALHNYQIKQEYLGNSSDYASADLIVVMTPQIKYGIDYVNQITLQALNGKAILIIGTDSVTPFAHFLNIDYPRSDMTRGGRIFDPIHNGGEKVYPSISAFGYHDVFSVVPTAIIPNFQPQHAIMTQETAGYADCYDSRTNPCNGSMMVGFTNNKVAYVADDWMFSNTITSKFPENIQLFQKIVQQLIGEKGTILFEETYLKWAPVNPAGVNNFIQIRVNIAMIVGILALFALLIPTIVGFQSNIFGSEPVSSDDYSESYQTIRKRLDYIHVERLPAAPLNLLETILMQEKLRYRTRGKYYFQYAAHQLLDYIEQREIMGQIPALLMQQLESLSSGLYNRRNSWEVIQEMYEFLISTELYKER